MTKPILNKKIKKKIDSLRSDLSIDLIVSNERNVRNGSGTGIGKTTGTIEYIKNNDEIKKWIIGVPTIKLANDMSFDYDIPVIVGRERILKTSPIEYSDEKCIMKGCSGCSDKPDCPYWKQDFHAPIIVMAYESVNGLGNMFGGWDKINEEWIMDEPIGLVYEEEPNRYWYQEMEVSEFIWDNTIKLNKNMLQTVWNNLKFKFWTDFDIDLENIDPNQHMLDYNLNNFVRSNENLRIHEYKIKGGKSRYTLIGHRKYMVPQWIERVIYNDATVIKNYSDIMFGSDMNWFDINHRIEITNPICRLGERWGNATQSKQVDNLYNLLFRLSEEGKKILVITKDKIEQYIPPTLADVIHYGNSRGYNGNYKKYDLIIVFGNFFWPPQAIAKYAQLGIGEDVIHEIEVAEIIQSLNRARLALQPDIPVILMTQDINYKAELSIKPSVLELWNKYPIFNSSLIKPLTKGKRALKYDYRKFVSWLQKNVFHEGTEEEMLINFLKAGKSVKECTDLTKFGKSYIYRLKKEKGL